MQSIAIDVGNTRIKAALFNEQELVQLLVFTDAQALAAWCKAQQANHIIIASTKGLEQELAAELPASFQVLILQYGLPLPISLAYATPQTLGADRVAAAVGGAALYPAAPVLIFDAGTCLTCEYVNAEAVYEGGAISPGLEMRLKAMNAFTARLPLLSLSGAEMPVAIIGKSTADCLKSGAYWGMLGEIESTILRYRQINPALKVILCGGDAKFFENKLKEHIFVVPELVLFGLNEILRYNVLQKKRSAPAV